MHQHDKTIQRVILMFPDLEKLWLFSRSLTNKQNLEINTQIKSIICDCSATDLEIAVIEFGATLFNQEKCEN